MLIATPEAGRFRVVDAFAKSVRLGSGLERTGHLSRGAIGRTLAALEVCAEKLERYRVEQRPARRHRGLPAGAQRRPFPRAARRARPGSGSR